MSLEENADSNTILSYFLDIIHRHQMHSLVPEASSAFLPLAVKSFDNNEILLLLP